MAVRIECLILWRKEGTPTPSPNLREHRLSAAQREHVPGLRWKVVQEASLDLKTFFKITM